MTASIPVGPAVPGPTLDLLRQMASRRFGLALPERFTLALGRGLMAAARLLAAPAPEALAQLDSLPDEAPAWQAILDCLTVRETTFFRQRGWWAALADTVLLPLLAARRREGTRRLTCLSIGCATGEEPYSLAILLDRLTGGEPGWTISITGLDLCASALAQAREGLFDSRALRELTDEERARWVRPEGSRFRITDALRERVEFRFFNISAAAEAAGRGAAVGLAGAPADFVLCRNVLIHMEPRRQPGLGRFLAGLVSREGSLAVAPVEATAAWFAPLVFRRTGPAIVFTHGRQTAAARPAAPDPAPPQAAISPPGPAPERVQAPGQLDQAIRLADLGLFDAARQLCGRALAESPEANLLMALVCQALGDLPAAEQAARIGVIAAPETPAAHYVHAIVSLRAGRTEAARQSLARAVSLLDRTGDGSRITRHLAIEAGEIRQAARRLGIAQGDRHVRTL